jgi:acetyl-CoA carboxylase biotin carboxylase subunit
VDTAAYAEYVIPPHYDSLIAKLIVHAPNRQEAINRMERALDMFVVEGIRTSIPLHRRILSHADFRLGNLYTRFIENMNQSHIRAVEMA